MPTYTNNASVPYFVENYNLTGVSVAPGESITTRQFYTMTDLDKTSDLPLYNLTTAQTSITLAEAQAEHVLDTDTDFIIIKDITGTVTVRPQTETAEEMMLTATSDSIVINFDVRKKFPCASIWLSGSGTCTVWEYLDIDKTKDKE